MLEQVQVTMVMNSPPCPSASSTCKTTMTRAALRVAKSHLKPVMSQRDKELHRLLVATHSVGSLRLARQIQVIWEVDIIKTIRGMVAQGAAHLTWAAVVAAALALVKMAPAIITWAVTSSSEV